ncbi:MAG TPA: hypothetical protein DEA44_02860 [Firmicutes bacterium]|nr:hypothetical protein [Bacillota bacterium]
MELVSASGTATSAVSAEGATALTGGADVGGTGIAGLNVDDVDSIDEESLATATSVGVLTQTGADKAITNINDAIEQVSAERSKLGAVQNRLEHTVANLNVASENLSAAESRVRDVDMALEMAKFTKTQILTQAGTAMMAQANMKPQGVLKLLG